MNIALLEEQRHSEQILKSKDKEISFWIGTANEQEAQIKKLSSRQSNRNVKDLFLIGGRRKDLLYEKFSSGIKCDSCLSEHYVEMP